MRARKHGLAPLEPFRWGVGSTAQPRAVAARVQELVRVPAGRAWAGLGLAVADDAGHDQVRVVEGGAVSVREGVPQLAALVNGARRLGGNVTRNTAGEAELLEQVPHPVRVLADAGIDLAVGAFEVRVGNQPWPTVSRTDDVD